MQSVLHFNILWSPSEAGPWANVDRGWGQPYCMFDWDNLFAAYMLSVHSKELAFSNLVQIVKSRTIEGFIPGYAKGTATLTSFWAVSRACLSPYTAPHVPIFLGVFFWWLLVVC